MSLDQLYQQVILDHAKARYGCGRLDPQTAAGRSHQVNPMCGDEITAEVGAGEPGARTLRWDGDGCSISMAAASVAAQIFAEQGEDAFVAAEAKFHELMHSRGNTVADEAVLHDAAAFASVSRFPARIKCALLAWIAMKDALVQAQASTHVTTTGGTDD